VPLTCVTIFHDKLIGKLHKPIDTEKQSSVTLRPRLAVWP